MSRPTDIDRLYGLEPVLGPEEGSAAIGLDEFADLQCPYCGELLTLHLDLSAGTQHYIEDCQVCCQPIEIEMQLAGDGRLEAVRAERSGR